MRLHHRNNKNIVKTCKCYPYAQWYPVIGPMGPQ